MLRQVGAVPTLITHNQDKGTMEHLEPLREEIALLEFVIDLIGPDEELDAKLTELHSRLEEAQD